MLKQFECLKCHFRFEADDRETVICPNCHSDNVEYAHFHIPKGVWKGVAALAIILLLGWIILLLSRGCQNVPKGDDLLTDSIPGLVPDSLDVVNEFIDEDVKITEPPKIAYSSDLKYDEDGYSFSVKIKNPPSRPYYVAIIEHRGEAIICKSEDGTHFKKVPPSKDAEGIYDIGIFDEKTDSLLGETTPKSGFIAQTKLKSRMTEQQLQSLIENDDMSLYGINESIDPNCKLHFTGLSSETKNIPTTMGEVMEKVGRMWRSVKVTKLQYNDKNRIVEITMAVQED